MAWTIEYDPAVRKDLRKLDRFVQQELLDYMDNRIAVADDPRSFGKPLRHSKYGLWRYRIGDYRILCTLESQRLVVHVVAIGHRQAVYKREQG